MYSCFKRIQVGDTFLWHGNKFIVQKVDDYGFTTLYIGDGNIYGWTFADLKQIVEITNRQVKIIKK